MTTRQAVIDRGDAIGKTHGDGDALESELYASAREAGVACFPGPEMDEDDDD
jgi:hypothetical protein